MLTSSTEPAAVSRRGPPLFALGLPLLLAVSAPSGLSEGSDTCSVAGAGVCYFICIAGFFGGGFDISAFGTGTVAAAGYCGTGATACLSTQGQCSSFTNTVLSGLGVCVIAAPGGGGTCSSLA